MKRYSDVVFKPTGGSNTAPVVNASITVKLAGTQNNATLYSDDGVTVTGNPVTSDSLGRFYFYVADGRYDLIVSATGLQSYTLLDQEIVDTTERFSSDTAWAIDTLKAGRTDDLYFIDGSKYAKSSAGIQSAIDAANTAGGGTVLLPQGVITTTTPITLKSTVRLVGQGIGTGTGAGTYISNSTGDVFNVASSVSQLNLENFFVLANTGHAFNFSGFLHSVVNMENIGIVQNVASKSCFRMVDTTGTTGFIDSTFKKCFWYYLLGNTVPAFHVSCSTFSETQIEDFIITALAGTTGGTYAFSIESTATGGQSLLSLKNIVLENPQGGGVRLLGYTDSKIEQLGVFDLTAVGVNAYIRIGAGSGGALSKRIILSNIYDVSGTAADPSVWIDGDTAGQTGFTIMNSNLAYVKGGVSATGAPFTVINSNIAASANFTSLDITQATITGMKRLRASGATAHVAGDYALSAGWGTSPSVSAVAATDMGGRVTITSGTGTPTANPTVTLTFKDGTFTSAPGISPGRGDTNTPTTGFWALTTASATAPVFTFVGTPAVSTAYVLDFVTMGR